MLGRSSTSGAYFNFINKKEGTFIRKSFEGDPSKIKYQYDWLSSRKELKCIPHVENLVCKWDFASYDLRYYQGYRTFFDVLKDNDFEKSVYLLKKILENLRLVHGQLLPKEDTELAKKYIEEKCFRKIAYCENLYPLLQELNKLDTLEVNGKKLRNISLLREGLNDEKILKLVGRYCSASIHGDLTAENILVGPQDEILFLDPNNENHIPSHLVDYTKLFQSLHSCYEEMCMLDKVEFNFGKITFENEFSSFYPKLLIELEKELMSILSPDERDLLYFHEAMHLARLLPYRLRVNDKTFLAFYATMLERFNDFFERVK